MTRGTPPAITVDRTRRSATCSKDAFEELVDIMDNFDANHLIVSRTANAVVAINRLKLVSVEQDPRFIRERVYGGDDRFADDLKHPALDGFANWRAVP